MFVKTTNLGRTVCTVYRCENKDTMMLSVPTTSLGRIVCSVYRYENKDNSLLSVPTANLGRTVCTCDTDDNIERKRLLTSTVPVNNFLLTRTLLNVCRCWLAMHMGAGILHWVLACHTIERKKLAHFLH